jgi:glycosyltransferase involved in cell wall biosynthesis
MARQHPGSASIDPGNPLDTSNQHERPQRKPSVLIHVLLPAQIAGRLKRFAPTLAEAGYRVSVIDVDHGDSRVSVLEQASIPVRHITLPRWTQTFYKSQSKIPWLLFKIARILLSILLVVRTRADIYHADDITALPACYLAARLRRKPLVYESHELPLVDQRTTRQPIIHAVSVWLLRRMLPRCSAIIIVSPPLVEEMQRRYGGPRAVVIRSVPKHQVAPTSDRLHQELGLGPATRIALYQGYVQPNRGLDLLVRAAKHLAPDTVIAIMGDGPSKPMLERLIADEGVGDRVRLLPAAPYAELLTWTASATIGLNVLPPDYSPSIYYCLPNKLFEYMMAGLPVLTSPLPAVVDVLRQYDAGQVVDTLKPAAVAQAINVMLADTEALTRMRANALAATRETLNWEVESQRLVSLYEQIERTSRTSKSRRAVAGRA